MERGIQRKRRQGRITFLVRFSTICLIVAFIGLMLIINFRVKNVEVEGIEHYTKEELTGMLMTEKTDSLSILFYLRSKFSKKKLIPFVESYQIEYVNKNTIKIKGYEKLVIGCVEVMGAYMYFDKDGIVVESSGERLTNVPLIKGLKYDKVLLYEPLEVQKSSLFDTILNLTKLVSLNELPAQSILFNSNLEVTLECDGNIVLCGRQENYDIQLSALKSILESAGENKYTFDLRNYSVSDTTVIAKPLE